MDVLLVPRDLDEHDVAVRKIAGNPVGVGNYQDEQDMEDHRHPERFPLARAGKFITRLDEEGGEVVHFPVSGFPSHRVEKIALLGLGTRRGRFKRDLR